MVYVFDLDALQVWSRDWQNTKERPFSLIISSIFSNLCFFFAVQTFSQTLFQRRREALDLIFRDEADSEWEEDASEWEDNTEENSDHRPAHEAGGGETLVSKGSFFFHKKIINL